MVAMLTLMVGLVAYAQDSNEGVEAKAKEGWVEVKTPWSFSYVLDSWIGMNEVHQRTFKKYTQYHVFSTSYKLDDKRKITLAVPFVVSKEFKGNAAGPSPVIAPKPVVGPNPPGSQDELNDQQKKNNPAYSPDGSYNPAYNPDGSRFDPNDPVYNSDGSLYGGNWEATKTPSKNKSFNIEDEQMPVKDFTLSSAYFRYDDSSLFAIGGNDVTGSVRLYLPTGALVSEEAREELPIRLRGNFGWSSKLMPNLKLGIGLEPQFYRNLKGDNGGEQMARLTATTNLSQSFDKFSLGLTAYTRHDWSYKKTAADPIEKGVGEDDERVEDTNTSSSSHNFGLFLAGKYKATDDVSISLGIDHMTPWKDIKFDTANASYNLAVVVSM